ncbi:MAG: molybdopterin-guanine dinucleotide biosynthesis protein A [Rhodospirillales bacterium 70-18]|nr:DUF3305 domain-containing protein [Rhodospirillales bacterium]OJY67361.1 MAG: molybdopterin-guanine dinucleotide biosynthesis protein A [Rhodospirillales bacterium 70-18]
MATETFMVGVVVERRVAVSPWIEHAWLPVAVLPGVPDLPPWSSLGHEGTTERFYAGAVAMELHRTDTATYRDNLASGTPRMWIACRPAEDAPLAIRFVTPDPAEGEAYTEAGDDIVEAVPMPSEIAALLAAFIAAHHVERPFLKRQRDRAGPAGPHRRPALEDDE